MNAGEIIANIGFTADVRVVLVNVYGREDTIKGRILESFRNMGLRPTGDDKSKGVGILASNVSY
jgi:hypothetical protein